MPKEYDLYSQKNIYANPYPLYQKLQQDYPVHLDSQLACWVVTTYADVASALANRDLSSERAIRSATLQAEGWKELGPLFAHISNLMFFADAPKHTRIRALMNKAFSARNVEKWKTHIQEIVDEQVDQVYTKGHIDIIRTIAFPLPARVIADILGIPAHDREQFKRWSDDLVEFLGNPPTLDLCSRLMKSLQEFMMYFRFFIEEHKKHPQDDLIDALLGAEHQGVALTEDEMLVNCVGLFAGGHETTANLIGNGLLALLRNPQELHRLRDNPQLISNAVEEFLRYDSPVQFTARIAKQTTEIGGTKVYKGQRMMLMLGAANRDPRQFYNPDRLDVGRQNNRHLAFGHNIHYCIGAPLARLEAQIAIDTILKRMPNLRLADTPLQWQENLSFHGLKELHIIF